jgi:hypothetical protein
MPFPTPCRSRLVLSLQIFLKIDQGGERSTDPTFCGRKYAMSTDTLETYK